MNGMARAIRSTSPLATDVSTLACPAKPPHSGPSASPVHERSNDARLSPRPPQNEDDDGPSGVRVIDTRFETVDDEIEEAPPTTRDPARVCEVMLDQIAEHTTLWQSARLAASLLRTALRARAVVVLAYTARTEDLRVVAAEGAGTEDMLGVVVPSVGDYVGATLLANEHPLHLDAEDVLLRVAAERHVNIGVSSSLFALPVVSDRGLVAIIEVVDFDVALAHRAPEVCDRAVHALLRTICTRATRV